MTAEYRVIVMPEAFEDLDEILDFVKRDSIQNAVETINRLWKATQSLSKLPHRYKIHRSDRRRDRIIRSMPVRPFIVYYRILENPATVRILTIRHGARRQPR